MFRPVTRALMLAALVGTPAYAQAVPPPQSASSAPLSDSPPPAPEAAADDAARQQARELGYAGVKAYAAGQYAVASEQLERSYALLPVPSLGLWSARALSKLRRLVEAERRYRDVARMHVDADAPEVQRAAQETAKAELLELLPRIPILRVQIVGVRPETVEILLDGTVLPFERWSRGESVDPGRHPIVGTYLGERSTVEVTASEGRESEIMLRFAQPAPPPAATPVAQSAHTDAWRVAGWVAVGTGAASLALSGIAYFMATGQHNQMKEDGICVSGECNAGDEVDRYNRLRTLQTSSLVGGLALGAAGAMVLVGTSSAEAARTRAGLRLGIGSAQVWGRF